MKTFADVEQISFESKNDTVDRIIALFEAVKALSKGDTGFKGGSFSTNYKYEFNGITVSHTDTSCDKKIVIMGIALVYRSGYNHEFYQIIDEALLIEAEEKILPLVNPVN